MVDQSLLVLKVAFVVLLYLFIWRVVRLASRGVRAGQESMVLAPVSPPQHPPRRPGRLVVARSPELDEGRELPIAQELVAGRDSSDLPLGADGYASGRHARFARGAEHDVVEDLHSTNGTFVNGERVAGPRSLVDGDLITIGQTQLVYRR